jgi:plastocyanin
MKTIGGPAIFIFLLFFSCTLSSKDDSESENESDSVEEDIPQQAQPSEESRTHIVEIKQMKFEPGEVKVRKGDRVLWVNKDITNHDVMEQSTKAWASSPLTTGQSWSLIVTKSEDYFCNLHQVMKGKITVEEPRNGVSK